MTKKELIRRVSMKTGVKSDVARMCVEGMMETIIESLSKKKDVHLRGFGSFQVIKKKEKKARNINKNKVMIIPEHFSPKFKPSDSFISRVKRLKIKH